MERETITFLDRADRYALRDSYIFMEFSNAEDASLAIRMMDGYPFDKRHKFSVNKFTDIEKLANLDEKYEEPVEEEYKDRVSILLY